SYMRGANYLWRGEDGRLHLWIDEGFDPWEETGWAEGKTIDPRPAAGVAIQQEIMDEYVMMRVAELIETGAASDAIGRALAKFDRNFGCLALKRSEKTLRWMLAAIKPAQATGHR